jgi:serine/threonine protein kinase/alpha-tubulin suppressor-like RCC1 family protein
LRWFHSEEAAGLAGLTSAREDPLGLDDFEVIRELGRGSTATVYHAHDRILGREVAVKVVHPSRLDDEESLARFTREARVVARLQHPGVVAVYSFQPLIAGGLALVMEYIPGRTLRDVIRAEGPLPVERVERIMSDVGEALVAAHAGGIIHRDVKPQNIFLHESTGRAMLADFGVAIPLHDAARITQSGAVIGTPAYMSPEQVDGLDLDGRSDLYSLGLVGWEMLTGTAPWEGENLFTIIYNQKQLALPSLDTFRPDVPARIRMAIEGALEKDRESRWSDIGEFLSRLSDPTVDGDGVSISQGSGQHPDARAVIAAGKTGGLLNPVDAPPDRPPLSGGLTSESAAPPVAAERRGVRARVWAGMAAVFAIAAVGLAVAGGEVRSGEDATGAKTSVATRAASSTRPALALPLGDSSLRQRADASDFPPPDSALPQGLDPATGQTEASVPPIAVSADSGSSIPEAGAEASTSLASANSTPEEPTLTIDRTVWSVAAGGMHSCMIDPAGTLACWGGNERGQLGGGGGPRQPVPWSLDIGAGARSVVAGGFHSCFLDPSGTAYCWGDNREGQLGGGTRGLDAGPLVVAEQRFASLALGIAHTCGIARDGVAYCWGSGAHGQLGAGSSQERARPARVATSELLVSLAAGWNHTCGLTSQGRALCWGDNSSGQLGDGTKVERRTPVRVAGDLRFQVLVAGSGHSCGLTPEGEVHCWGENGDGRLGDGGTSDRATPTRLLTALRFVQLTAGGRHTCGVTADGRAHCWGQNNYGQLGDGSSEPRSTPVRVEGDIRFASVVAGGSHTCGTGRNGARYCWGYNIEGQLGDGTLVHGTTPQRVTTGAGGVP